jgi:alkylhydroperoxidase/carboxymuconolactone decarboxylase family protein YurZ
MPPALTIPPGSWPSQSGVTRQEIDHVAILAITTIGWPGAYAAMTWVEDEISNRDGSR